MQNIMEELLAGSALARLEEGQIVGGVITEICQNEVSIDVGAKSEGRVRLSEFEEPAEVHPGMAVDVFLAKLEDASGCPVLCYDRAKQQKNWERIAQTVEEGAIVTGKVKAKTRGGLTVSIGVDAFLPMSQVDLKPTKGVEELIGRTYEFKVVKINHERRNIVLSRRELLEEERWRRSKEIFDTIKVGDIVRGSVKNITDYGAFVDLDGVDGLLHVTDIGWGRITHPSQSLRVGEELTVMVIAIDKERERISLGLKQTMPNPWDDVERRYPVGACVRGKVVNLVPYGAFVELEEGLEALIHITEFSWWKKISKPADLLRIGQEVEAVVIAVSAKEQKISLGLRQLEENPWEQITNRYPVGSTVSGVVQNMTNYGAFVELEPGVQGMVHVSDISWTRRLGHPSEVFKVGDQVEAMVMSVDLESRRISLSVKNLGENPWSNIQERIRIGDRLKGKVVKLTNFGAFLELPGGIDGFIHISQIQEERAEKVSSVLSLGQEVEAVVIRLDPTTERIALSIKALNYDEEALRDEIEAWKESSGPKSEFGTIGDLFERDNSGA
ncbi:MAG: 30S ribosomal protein S1 [Puniceicoccales bacterium]|jgi:small subunit ribosomal protein S1|nr:30S ribosomal protein S1 [Puniceicoccales bacterium]